MNKQEIKISNVELILNLPVEIQNRIYETSGLYKQLFNTAMTELKILVSLDGERTAKAGYIHDMITQDIDMEMEMEEEEAEEWFYINLGGGIRESGRLILTYENKLKKLGLTKKQMNKRIKYIEEIPYVPTESRDRIDDDY